MTALKNYQPTKNTFFSSLTTFCISLAILLLLNVTAFAKTPKELPPYVPIVASTATATGAIGTLFIYNISVIDTLNAVYTATGLPSWLTINSVTGTVSGTPTAGGTYSFIITVTNPSNGFPANQTLTIIIPYNPWLLTGNAGTDTSKNFIGTTDNQDVIFKRNGIRSGMLNSAITAFGVGAGALGGFSNTSIGAYAGSMGTANTANANTAVGADALQNNVTGNSNTAIGTNSLVADSSGDENTGVGMFALFRNISGVANVALGANTLVNTTSSSNTGVGEEALYNNTSGTGNTGVGFGSLSNNHTGQYNTGLGTLTNVANANTSYAIALGYNANAIANQLALSDSIHTIKAKGLPTGVGYVLTDVAGNGNLSLQPNTGGSSTAWNLLGNAGTDTSINFIGTTDNVDVTFKRGGIRAGLLQYHIDPLISKSNTSWGVYALKNNTTGNGNTAIGVYALQYNNSGYNTAIGDEALWNNTTGSYNTASGNSALQDNTTGRNNTATGSYALTDNNSGTNNTAIGYYSLQNNTQGNNNTAVGYQTSVENGTGNYNTAIGDEALFYNVGNNNVGVGYNAGPVYNASGVNNSISLGTNANALSYQFALSDSIQTIKAKGIPTGTGYVLTDVVGNGILTLQPSAGLTAAQLAALNAGIAGSWSITGNSISSAANNFFGTKTNSSIHIRTNNIEYMVIDSVGRVGIGINAITDTAYKLYVEKGIRTRKVKVDLDAWADFVFDANYKLPSLTDVENYIQQNKHLRDVPSAIDVQKNGLDLGENQKILLQKVEELTLYIIDQNKKIDAQNKETEEQNKKINELQDQNDQLQQLKKEVDELKILLQKKENG